ncbi:MAG: hypothetical protein C0478_01350 [Planctomyces sp.]|nr:hypothetical protein [Planctomyces sp.]
MEISHIWIGVFSSDAPADYFAESYDDDAPINRDEPSMMNISIVNSFLADQRRAKRILSAKLGIPYDIRALEWAFRSAENRRSYMASPFAEIFRIHGYGIELKIGDLHIDFDYSESGRPDGFDSWRIFIFITDGKYGHTDSDDHISERVDEWFKELVRIGRIERLDNLYYFTEHHKVGA